jgi:hypothetical protein
MTMKCEHCLAPVDFNEHGEKRFDSSRYYMDAVKKLSEISALRGQVEQLSAEVDEHKSNAMTAEYLLSEMSQDTMTTVASKVLRNPATSKRAKLAQGKGLTQRAGDEFELEDYLGMEDSETEHDCGEDTCVCAE